MTKIVCDGCQQRIGVEAIIPSEAWEVIANGAYALCPVCIDERLTKANIICNGLLFFRGKSLLIHIDPELEIAMRQFRPSQMQVDRDGNVGILSLKSTQKLWIK